MHFSKHNNFYRVSWISGPRHNALTLAFADDGETSEPLIEMLPPIGECRHDELKEDAILAFVLEGVKEANRVFKTNLRVSRVGYIANDTPPENRYAGLAYKIVERLASNGEFQNSV